MKLGIKEEEENEKIAKVDRKPGREEVLTPKE